MPLLAFVEPAVQAFACVVAHGNERGVVVNNDVNDSPDDFVDSTDVAGEPDNSIETTDVTGPVLVRMQGIAQENEGLLASICVKDGGVVEDGVYLCELGCAPVHACLLGWRV
jgi:hypothetical protein